MAHILEVIHKPCQQLAYKAPVSLYTQAVHIFPTRCHGKNGHFWICLMNLQSLLSKLVYIQKSFGHNQVYGIG